MPIKLRIAAALLASASPLPAYAAPVVFTGQFSNDTPTPLPDASCAAGQVLVNFNPGNSTAAGTSNFGNFGPSQTHCISPGQPYAGTFSFAFGIGDTLFGTTTGFMTPTAITGVVNSFNTYTVTGGTGQFAGASGVINGVGLLDRRPARPLNSLDLTGSLNLPVPEPATWAMMVVGFGLLGGALRRRGAATNAVVLKPNF